MHAYRYIIFGLRIAANLPLSVLPARHDDEPPDVIVDMAGVGTCPRLPAPEDLLLNGIKQQGEQNHRLRVYRSGDLLHVHYLMAGEYVDFSLSAAGDRVRVVWSDRFPVGDIPAFFLGPVIGSLLRLRGVLTLHAGVIDIDDVAIAVVGEKGAGKSSLVAAFARLGYPILSDDTAPVFPAGGAFRVWPGYPLLRLWPDTLDWMGCNSPGLPRVESIFEKRYLALATDTNDGRLRFCDGPRPLAAVYALVPGQHDPQGEITAETPARGLRTLLRNSYADYVLDRAGRLEQFRRFVEFAARVPLRIIRRPDGLDTLPAFCDAIDRDVRGIVCRKGRGSF